MTIMNCFRRSITSEHPELPSQIRADARTGARGTCTQSLLADAARLARPAPVRPVRALNTTHTIRAATVPQKLSERWHTRECPLGPARWLPAKSMRSNLAEIAPARKFNRCILSAFRRSLLLLRPDRFICGNDFISCAVCRASVIILAGEFTFALTEKNGDLALTGTGCAQRVA